jgi:hypothetical protein
MRPALESWRFFPTLRWAWPAGGLDQLLLAAACPDEGRARAALDAWLNVNDIDAVEYRDQRLLVAITDRFGTTLAARPEWPRLAGLQRHLWTRSRMAIAEAATALRRMVDVGIPVMLLKGAARIAAEPDSARARMAHDVDVLVPPERFADAMDTLFDTGWTASSGESQLCLRRMATGIRAMNFFRDRFGDFDLHQWAYGVAIPHDALQRVLWDNAQPAQFLGVQVLVPSETDRAALAIVNSGLDAHTHSDWLVDCSRLVTRRLEWDRLLATLRDSGTVLPAQVALSYLAHHVGSDVPTEFLSTLLYDRAGGALRRTLALLQAKPRANWTQLARVGRNVAKQLCRVSAHRAVRPGTILRGKIIPATSGLAVVGSASRHRLAMLHGTAGLARIRLDLVLNLPGPRRRIEFELNTREQHIARLRGRSLRRRRGPFIVRFEGEIDLPAGDHELWVEARPGRQLRSGEDEQKTLRYAALPCGVIACKLLAPQTAQRGRVLGQVGAMEPRPNRYVG